MTGGHATGSLRPSLTCHPGVRFTVVPWNARSSTSPPGWGCRSAQCATTTASAWSPRRPAVARATGCTARGGGKTALRPAVPSRQPQNAPCSPRAQPGRCPARNATSRSRNAASSVSFTSISAHLAVQQPLELRDHLAAVAALGSGDQRANVVQGEAQALGSCTRPRCRTRIRTGRRCGRYPSPSRSRSSARSPGRSNRSRRRRGRGGHRSRSS